MEYNDDNLPEAPGCPVMEAQGITRLNEVNPEAAMEMLLEHIRTNPARTCCDSCGFAFPVDAETGCTEVEMYPRITIKPVQLALTAQGNLFGKEIA